MDVITDRVDLSACSFAFFLFPLGWEKNQKEDVHGAEYLALLSAFSLLLWTGRARYRIIQHHDFLEGKLNPNLLKPHYWLVHFHA